MVHFQVFQKGGVTVKGLIYLCKETSLFSVVSDDGILALYRSP